MQPKKSDWENLDVFIREFANINQEFIQGLDNKRVASLDNPLMLEKLSEKGVDFQSAIEKLKQDIIPNLSASRGPRYWGFVTGGATPVATFADWLISTFDQNVSIDGDSIAANIERQTLRWLVSLFELPDTFDGIITTGATSANFLGALCARQFAGNQQSIDVAKQGVTGLEIDIFSTTPHSSMLKSLGMAGLGQDNIIIVDSLKNSEAMDVNDLQNKLDQSNAKSKFIIASAGTVTGTDFDDLVSIAEIAQKHKAWLHVDAAFGIFERLVNQEKLSCGLEQADSITLDSHKWLNVPYENGVFLTRHLPILQASCDVPAAYLPSTGESPAFMSLGVENSRRFRALPVWMTLLVYGKLGITSWVKNNIDCAQLFAQKIKDSKEYELVRDCQLNVVLFRPNCSDLSLEDADKKTDLFLQRINQQGRVFLSPGIWNNKKVIRAAFSNWQTQKLDVDIAITSLTEIADQYHSY